MEEAEICAPSLIPTITRPDFIPFAVRYLCSNVPYDYSVGGFRDFPERQGWVLYGEPGKTALSKFIPLDGTDGLFKLSEKVALLQAWMFFGVLAEASSIYGLDIDIEDEFVSNTKDGKVISTAPLNGLPERWLHEAKMHGDYKGRCVKVGELCEYLECRIFDLRDEKNTVRFNFDECEALLSIEIVYRTLLLSLVRSREYDATSIQPLLKPKFFDYQLKLHRRGWIGLQKRGWCFSEMRMLSALNRELPYAFFATTLQRYPLDHGCCSEFQCMADQINEETYEVQHVDPGCQCAFACADVEQLCSILSRGEIPTILVSQDLQLQVVSGHKFVAISHVCKFS